MPVACSLCALPSPLSFSLSLPLSLPISLCVCMCVHARGCPHDPIEPKTLIVLHQHHMQQRESLHIDWLIRNKLIAIKLFVVWYGQGRCVVATIPDAVCRPLEQKGYIWRAGKVVLRNVDILITKSLVMHCRLESSLLVSV